MNTEQLLKQVYINRDLILRRSEQAQEHLTMLKKEYAHLFNEDILLNLDFNTSLFELYLNSDYTAAIDNSMSVLDRFKDSPNSYMLALHLKMVGHCYAHTGEPDLAERYLMDALATLSGDESNNAIRADILHELAMTTEYRDAASEKIKDLLLTAIELLKGEKHIVRRANCQMGLGNYYNNINEVLLALDHYKTAVEIFEREYLLANMANCYSNMGSCYLKLRDYTTAEKFLDKALELRLKSGSPEQLSISYFNLGVLYKERQEFDRAGEMLCKALRMTEELGNKHFIDRINTTLHELEMQRNNAESAPLFVSR